MSALYDTCDFIHFRASTSSIWLIAHSNRPISPSSAKTRSVCGAALRFSRGWARTRQVATKTSRSRALSVGTSILIAEWARFATCRDASLLSSPLLCARGKARLVKALDGETSLAEGLLLAVGRNARLRLRP
jgi:hypothetical protein